MTSETELPDATVKRWNNYVFSLTLDLADNFKVTHTRESRRILMNYTVFTENPKK